jgi:two-component system, response regulator FlrC
MCKTLSVLIVDDHPMTTQVMADILEAKGFEVYQGISGWEALEILQSHEVNVLMTDLNMPEMDGFELYREARKTHPRMTTFLLTAYTALVIDNLTDKAKAEGIARVFIKPVDLDALIILLTALKNALV